jgi:hypothetical protein
VQGLVTTLEEDQHRVDLNFACLLVDVMTRNDSRRKSKSRGSQFSLDWDNFYFQLDKRLRPDAYLRYKKWTSSNTPATRSQRDGGQNSTLWNLWPLQKKQKVEE